MPILVLPQRGKDKKLNEDAGFFEQAGKELDKAMYSIEIIAENEELTEKKQVEIYRIFKDKITKFKSDGLEFTVNAIHIIERNGSTV